VRTQSDLRAPRDLAHAGVRATTGEDDPLDLMRAIYGLSTAGSVDDWPAKARKFVDILLQGSRP